MELRHLHYFIAVAEELHFSRAAVRLCISQPPLSQQIRSLEDELGVKLFERTKRQVHLTEAGKVFLERSYLVLAQLEQAIEVTQRIGRGEVGRLALGFVGSATYTVLPEILSVFRSQFPAVELRLHELTTAEQIQALHQKQIDIGIVRAISEPGLSVECILQESLVLALPETHPFSAQTQVSLSTLAAELFILFPAKMGPVFYEQIIHICQQAGFRPQVAQEAVQMQTIVGLVAAGLGIAFVPASLQNFHRSGVIYRPLQEQTPKTGLYLTWRQHDPSPVIKAFLGLARKTTQSESNCDDTRGS
ncbi:LysR family transcriptional regulator [Chroococcidiopsis sp. FACHB-1243]|uniref:LysR substrate-binding domain-containing protein n=1 Tax=Chroococcidiopsis sp. [FACHB-1243] TaxID=2692781 RepID=UPI00177D7FB3|nr:LysR substrate-binding domain-containing protein [Chroococcidiopsis sp. [FACHB-1243]]MBD2309127.1 LysR family transcriptional regulator [Chroococcidiopsis sp. [FACHB-1243]]